MEALHQHILHVMSGQSPGYLINADAAAFMAIGLDDYTQVDEALKAMGEEGLVEYLTVEETREEKTYTVAEGADGLFVEETEEVKELVDWGWTITEKGRKAV